MMTRRVMKWAGRPDYMGGIPRKIVIAAVGILAKAWVNLLNSTTVHNADTLLNLVRSRPTGLPLITVSNHMSTLDDPFLWAFKGFPTCDANLSRWVLAAEDICFKNPAFSYFFRLGRCWFEGGEFGMWWGLRLILEGICCREVYSDYERRWDLSGAYE